MNILTITLEGKSVDIDVSGSFFHMSLDEQVKNYIKPALAVLLSNTTLAKE